jgi:hypothetical protein
MPPVAAVHDVSLLAPALTILGVVLPPTRTPPSSLAARVLYQEDKEDCDEATWGLGACQDRTPPSVDQSTLHAIVVRMSGQPQASCLCLQRFGMEQTIMPVNCQFGSFGGSSRSPDHASGVGGSQLGI